MADCIEQVPFVQCASAKLVEMSERRTCLPNKDNKAMGFVQLIRLAVRIPRDFARAKETWLMTRYESGTCSWEKGIST